MAGRPTPASTSRRDRIAGAPLALLALAVALGVVIPVLTAALSGNLRIPHDDAWAYSRIARTFARTGHIQLLGWGRQAMFGQFVVIGPFARWIVAQHIYVAALGLVSLLATYDLLRPFTGPRRAAGGAVLVALWPGFALLDTSFMSDVPAFTASLVCLAVGRRAIASGSWWTLLVSFAFGLWGCTIREQVLAAPAAVFVVAAWQAYRRRAGIVRLIAVAIVFGALFGAFELWRHSYSGEDPGLRHGKLQTGKIIVQTALQGYFLLALVLTPAVVLVSRPWRWGPLTWIGTGLGAALAYYSVHKYRYDVFFSGNYFARGGPYTAAGNGTPAPVISLQVWHALVLVACVSGTLLAGLIVRRLRHLDPILLMFALFTAAGTIAVAASGQQTFDRYWLPLMPPLLALVLSDPVQERPRGVLVAQRALAGAALAGLTAITFAVAFAGFAYDHARWSTATTLARRGVPAVDINAGLEWVGYHAPRGMVPPHSHRFPGTRSCYVVSASPPKPGGAQQVVATSTYRNLLITGSRRTIYVYRTAVPDCPQPRS